MPDTDLKFWREFGSLLDKNLLYGVTVAAIIPGISEEVMFRGFVLNGLVERYGRWIGILAAGLLFGLFHLDPYRILPTAFLGCVLGYMVVMTGSIYPAIITHATYNLSLIVIPRVHSLSDLLKEKMAIPASILIPSSVLFAVSLYALTRIHTKGLSVENRT